MPIRITDQHQFECKGPSHPSQSLKQIFFDLMVNGGFQYPFQSLLRHSNHSELGFPYRRPKRPAFERFRISGLGQTSRIAPISMSSLINFIPDELERGDSSTVPLSSNSKGELIAVKTFLNQNSTELIRREASILKTLNHPLILELQEQISNADNHNSAIVIEFAGNGSIANHFPPAKGHLSGANSITKVIVGIALAMPFWQSR
jgi:hypothetical protein